MRGGSDMAGEATLVCVLVTSAAILSVSDCLPRHPPTVLDMMSLKAADDVVTSQTRHVSTDVIEAKRQSETDESSAEAWLRQYNRNASQINNEDAEATWAYYTNITEENKQKTVESNFRTAEWAQQKAEEAKEYDFENFQNANLIRQFRFVTDIGSAAMKNKAKLKEMKALESDMQGIYGTAKVCLRGKDLKLEPDLYNIMATDRRYSRLLAAWTGWRKAVGRPLKPLYRKFVDYSNEAIRDLGYNDTGEYWRSRYESSTFQEDLNALLEQLFPLYSQLQAYVRQRLRKHYGKNKFPPTGHIPAHLLGNMWAQTWDNIYDMVQPYPNRTAIDVTAAMKRQNYTVLKMFETAETFFTSLGFDPLPESFWNKSVLVKLEGREMVCHASAWDFSTGDDFRIKMCTLVNHEDLVTVHHEMGHIQYGMQYRAQPFVFRDGANPGFHEAVGDTISLSVNTPAHLRNISLLDNGEDNKEDEINFLLKMALGKVAFLPFGYLIDQWRWSVFAGETKPDQYNQKWWKLRCRYQGIFSPVPRYAEDFDPGAKFHIPSNVPYIRYFVSFVLQFQFHQALCKESGHTGKLHLCDIYHSRPAGDLLRAMLSKGKSTPWPDVLQEMTGDRKLNANAILDYFSPLYEWLKEQNNSTGECVGWSQECPPDDWSNVKADYQCQ